MSRAKSIRQPPSHHLVLVSWWQSVLVGFLLLCAPASVAKVFSGERGSVAVVPVEPDIVEVQFLDRPQLLWREHAIVGIPLLTGIGNYGLKLRRHNGSVTQFVLLVIDREYPEERIEIADDKMVTPPAVDLERIKRESAEMRAVYARFSEQPSNLTPIIQPVVGRVSGVFGSQRFFNDQPRNPHSGVDYAAPAGTPILAPAPGVVALTGDFYFNGKTVMLDHGGGFVSMMCHLETISVTENQFIVRNEVIGRVGSTGRSTGPHLHWSVSLSGHRVDPQTFMDLVNEIYDGE